MTDQCIWIQSVGVVWMLFCLSMTEGLTCLSCTEIGNPDLCEHVTNCGPHETCYSQERVTSAGKIVWDLGCRDTLHCSSGGKREEPNPRDISSGDVAVCDECCHSDLCNRQSCGHISVPASDRGPLCYHCDYASSPDGCGYIRECGRDFICNMYYSGSMFHMGCYSKGLCQRLMTGGHCNYCCDGDLCNGVCSDIKTTTPAIITPPPTLPPRTNDLVCYSCRDATTAASCQEVARCGDHQSCYMDEVLKSDGTLSYKFGCRNVDVCSGSSPMVGKRAGDLVTCSRCCQTDLCQKTLCGKNDLMPRADRGPVCLKGITSEANATASDVIECSRDQACYQSFGYSGTSSGSIYEHGCVSAKVCAAAGTMSGPSSCFKCCLSDVCNVGCH